MTDALLATLQRRASHRGHVLVRATVLQEELGCSLEVLEHALTALRASGQVRILSPLPYLVVALPGTKWRGDEAKNSKSGLKSGPPAPRSYSYSLHKHAIDQSKAIAEEDEGAGEGEILLQEILTTLGERDPTSFRGVFEHFPAATIRSVLARVRATPEGNLRKSRTALFRFLLSRTK